MTREQIIASYAPYHTWPAFAAGMAAYLARFPGKLHGDHGYHGVDEQAWDRGTEAAMRIAHLPLETSEGSS